VELVKAGAADYIAKPWDDDKLVATARNLLELRAVSRAQQRLLGERRQRRQSLAAEYDLCGTVYESEAMHDVLLMAARVAGSDVPVLITGPNGAGKEKIAQVVQANSRRASAPFLTVNMGALPSELMESELFGAEAGAYTGANKARAGRFEVADGGTLFLDEIGNLSLPGQAKLLRVLQTGEFERLGSNVTRRTSVRVLSATNMDLKEAIAAGTFREDLFYRLNVIELRIPALAERPDDILPLARHFLGDNYDLPAETERAMLAYPWPGNVRELRNAMERARVLATGRRIAPDLLGLEKLESGGPATGAPASADSIDRRQLQEALVRHDGIVARAARDLGLSRQAFYRRMDKHGIPRD
jgi:DNA-binding NtrC family response regulator